MDVVWLKLDVRLHDHGPLWEACQSGNPVCILYLYEPDQLAEPTVHGSHILFVNEGLLELDRKLLAGISKVPPPSSLHDEEQQSSSLLHVITVYHAECTHVLEHLHNNQQGGIKRILAHEETGHYASFDRDKRVRKWCRHNGVNIMEYPQTGVTRCLKSRDDFSKLYQAFLSKPRYGIPNLSNLQKHLVRPQNLPTMQSSRLLTPQQLPEIPTEHKNDREDRQHGGETQALRTLDSFLECRGELYSKHISSPISSWMSCARLSPYLTWGNVSIRHVVHAVRARQEILKNKTASSSLSSSSPTATAPVATTHWKRSLTAFLSRMHWRSHFMQKLETEPILEKQDVCPAYQQLRRQPGDWNQDYYQAWAQGMTGYPFLDACMRCLLKHGWINFRMRAMLVSFACYNLWLDWKGIAPHLARVFLDYEPGIHYSQLQMQAGTTGINAMRVYSVTKQGKDQDPQGIFIRKYIPELARVPEKYIHQPWKMSEELQNQYGVTIGLNEEEVDEDEDCVEDVHHKKPPPPTRRRYFYPEPIVDETATAKVAKQKVGDLRKLPSTLVMAQKVYEKHGSRANRFRRDVKGLQTKSDKKDGQKKLSAMFPTSRGASTKRPLSDVDKEQTPQKGSRQKATDKVGVVEVVDCKTSASKPTFQPLHPTEDSHHNSPETQTKPTFNRNQDSKEKSAWTCKACTFVNDKPLAPVCYMCGTSRTTTTAS